MEQSKPEYAGMTVNERLFTAGLLVTFDEAIQRGDRDAMIEMLTAVELGEQAAGIADASCLTQRAMAVCTARHEGCRSPV